jgi:hypothetical protein
MFRRKDTLTEYDMAAATMYAAAAIVDVMQEKGKEPSEEKSGYWTLCVGRKSPSGLCFGSPAINTRESTTLCHNSKAFTSSLPLFLITRLSLRSSDHTRQHGR